MGARDSALVRRPEQPLLRHSHLRSGTLPQGAAILWVGAAVLSVASLNPSVYLGAWIAALIVALDLGESGWIAWSIRQQPITRTPVS